MHPRFQLGPADDLGHVQQQPANRPDPRLRHDLQRDGPQRADHPDRRPSTRHAPAVDGRLARPVGDRKSTRLNSSHGYISYAVFCLKKKSNAVKSHGEAAAVRSQHLFVVLDLILVVVKCSFFFNDTATTEIYTLSLHDALPISSGRITVNLASTFFRQIGGRKIDSNTAGGDRKSTRLNSSHGDISYAVFGL